MRLRKRGLELLDRVGKSEVRPPSDQSHRIRTRLLKGERNTGDAARDDGALRYADRHVMEPEVFFGR